LRDPLIHGGSKGVRTVKAADSLIWRATVEGENTLGQHHPRCSFGCKRIAEFRTNRFY